MNTTANPAANDVPLCSQPGDSISAVAFSPTAAVLGVAAWDGSVRIYEVSNGQSVQKAQYEHEASAPVLSLAWAADGSTLYSAGADKAARAFDLRTMQATQVAVHDQPIMSVRWCQPPGGQGFLATASLDKTLKVSSFP